MSDKNEPKGRNYRLYIRLDTEERAELEKRAAEVGISPSNYARQRSLGTLRARSDAMAIRQLVGVGNNLNQIARGANSGDPLTADLATTLAEVRSAVFALKKKEAGNDNGQD